LTAGPKIDTHPAISPDGAKLAFQSNRDGNYEIYLMNLR
jgi:TolB protein